MSAMLRGVPLLACLFTAFGAQAATPDNNEGVLTFGARYRHETVDQANALHSAESDTLRLRVGYKTPTWFGLSAFAESDFVGHLGSTHYNSTRNGSTGYSVIADPDGAEINQALLRFANKQFSVQAGRQRINFDNQRFIGGVAWRQNEQTFDGAWVQWTPNDRFVLDYAWIDNVNTIFGPDAPSPYNATTVANLHGDSYLAHAQVKFAPALTLTGYQYRLNLDNLAVAAGAPLGTASSRTTGIRAAGQYKGFSYALEQARQSEMDGNPWQLDSRYSLIELGYSHAWLQTKIGRETLGAGSSALAGNRAFQTPLATKHIFQGWADVFLTTPAAGLQDSYAGLIAKGGGQWQAWYHDFKDDRSGARYGRELDLSYGRPIPGVKGLDGLIKFARYRASDARTVDTDKLWLQLDYRY